MILLEQRLRSKTPKGIKHLRIFRGAAGSVGRYAGDRLLLLPPTPREIQMNRIRAARQALGWTQNDLAVRANVSPRTIHAVEKGRPCRQATKRHILNALGVPWEMRNEYFVRVRSVRPVPAIAAEARTA